MIGEGKTRAQIIAFYRAQYGEKVLSAPTTEGFNILAWTMPFIALAHRRRLDGARVRTMALDRPRLRIRTPAASPASFDPELRRKLEKELEERR